MGKICSKVPTYQGPILALIYPFFTNTGNKDNISLTIHARISHFFYKHTFDAGDFTKKFTNVYHDRRIYILFYEQVVCKKGYKMERLT